MKHSLSALVALAVAVGSNAVAEIIEKTGVFIVLDGSNTDYGLFMPLPSRVGDSAQRIYSGQALAKYTFDSETLEIKTFTFEADPEYSEIQIYTAPPPGFPPDAKYNIDFATIVDYPTIGSQVTYVTRAPITSIGRIIKFQPETIVFPPGLLTADGNLINFQHVFHTYAGDMVTGRAVGGSAQPQVFSDYRLFPEDVPMKGVVTPEIQDVGSTIYARTLATNLTFELDERETITLPGTIDNLDLDVDETEIGTIYAKTINFTIPTDYGRWTTDNGLGQQDPEELNEAGIAYGILFALDLPADTSTLPISVVYNGSEPLLQINLPEEGLLNSMYIEYSPDLVTDPWPQLPATYYVNGPESLDKGATGTPQFRYPPGERGFMRFVTILEEP